MFQPTPVPATPFAERLRAGAGRRAFGIGLALLIEGVLLLLLLSLGVAERPGDKEEEGLTVVNLAADAASDAAPEPSSPKPEQRTEERRPVTEEPLPQRPVEPKVAPTVPALIPTPYALPPSAAIRPNPVPPAPSNRPSYGPPDKGGSSSGDTERVGTAPNGEPLYAAAWYREPSDEALGAYLSTARGPGWGLIACRTVPDYRVEDCVPIAEYPKGSRINRAILAAAWEFRVRPPRRGGRPMVGSWVRIRIDYGIERRYRGGSVP